MVRSNLAGTYAVRTTMSPVILSEEKTMLLLDKELKQLINITLAGGKFILLHPHYQLIRETLRMNIIDEQQLEELEITVGQYEVGEMIHFSVEELLFLYSLVEISCRLFVCEIGDDLKRLAIECGDTTEEEFARVRSFFLHQAESYLHTVNEALYENEEFQDLKSRLEQLNAIV